MQEVAAVTFIMLPNELVRRWNLYWVPIYNSCKTSQTSCACCSPFICLYIYLFIL